MTIVIDTRVSPQMRECLLVNRQGKLHSEQRREVVTEPVVTILLLMVPAIILLRRFLLTLFVGSFWMLGVGALLLGGFMLYMRSRRYARIPVYFDIFRAPEKPPSRWLFWKPIRLMTATGTIVSFKNSLAPDKSVQANQEYLVYYLKSAKANTLLSFAPTDHLESTLWKPTKDFEKHYNKNK
jgi:hypothetical protein